MASTDQNVTEFKTLGYTFIAQLVPKEDQEALCQHAVRRSATPTMRPDNRVPTALAAFADPHMEDLLERLLPAIERITRLQLFPTYSYFRVYKKGDVLERHTDRLSCEISVSISLGYQAAGPWPIWIQGPRGQSSFKLQPGDAVVYRGMDCPHWREPFNGDSAVQVFLHYVDQHGPQAEWKFDKRRRLGTIPRDPIHISERVQPIQPDGMLRLISGQSVQLKPLGALVMKDLEAERTVPVIVEHAMKELNLSRPEAEIAVMAYVSLLEEKGLLIFSQDAPVATGLELGEKMFQSIGHGRLE